MLKRICDATGCSLEASMSGSLALDFASSAEFDACSTEHAQQVIDALLHPASTESEITE